MKTVTIIRGLPGSGKSTFAKLIADKVFEADQFFYEDGEYKYDVSKIGEAHDECFKRFKESVKRGCENIAVANTFTEEWEFEKYKEFAEKTDYKVFVIIMENRHDGKNIYGVPEGKIAEMRERFEFKL